MFLGSLFAIYILRTLEMSNLILGFCGTTWWAGNISSSKYWGEFSKVHGYVYILKISIISLTILPISWIFVYYAVDPYRVFIILFTSFIAGITFSGFSLSTFNLVYEIVDKGDVVKYTSILRFGEGIGILFASIIAGYLVDSMYINNFLSNMNFNSVQLSIFISMILRCFCLVFFVKNENLFNA